MNRNKRKIDFSVDVLGTTYSVVFVRSDDFISLKEGEEGRCDFSIKQIKVRDTTDADVSDGTDAMKDQLYLVNNVVKHELIHAFLFECGQSDYACDEILVELLALNFEKIYMVMKESDCLNTIGFQNMAKAA